MKYFFPALLIFLNVPIQLLFSQESSKPVLTNTTISAPDSISDSSTDSPMHSDTLMHLVKRQSLNYSHENFRFLNSLCGSSAAIFHSDAPSPSEFLRNDLRGISSQVGISSSLNRYLPYGNVAPVNKIFNEDLFPIGRDPFDGSDNLFATQFTEFSSMPDGNIQCNANPSSLIVPEAVIFWENGVFDENIFDLRFSRPIARSLSLNFYSNFRHFNRQTFSHDGNDMYSFYRSMVPDTSFLSHKGYNPLTNEQYIGGRAEWSGNITNGFLQFSYGDAENEIAFNKADTTGIPYYYSIHRYPFTLSLGASGLYLGDFGLDAQAQTQIEPYVRTMPVRISGTTGTNRNDAKIQKFEFALQPYYSDRDLDTAGLHFEMNYNTVNQFNDSEHRFLTGKSFFKFDHAFQTRFFDGLLHGHAGASYFLNDNKFKALPALYGAAEFGIEGKKLNFYLEKDYIDNGIPIDTALPMPPILDNYVRGGCELQLGWEKAGLLLGYQYIKDIDSTTIASYWIISRAPYRQPSSVWIFSPTLGPWKGLSFMTKAFFSNTKPVIKFHSELSFTTHPLLTQEYIDITLGFDFWSKRDSASIQYAGIDDWNKAIYNLNLEIAAQIKSFRLFYKIDNILNERFSYVPGYYMPGITFRWGLNWFIQR